MQPYDYLKGSDGTGNAVLAHVTLQRLVASTTLKVDSVSKWPVAAFIATVGTLDGTGFINPATVTEFVGHITAGDIIIDSFESGSTDIGNTAGQIVVIKQTTGWANRVNQSLVNDAANIAAFAAANGDWRALGGVPVYSTNDTAGQFKLTVPADITATVARRHKARVTRSVAPPIQSMYFQSSLTQFATRAAGSVAGWSITGVTATGEAWVYLNQLPANGTNMSITSKNDGTNGITLDIDAVGCITLRANTGGVERNIASKRGISAGRWYHIAAAFNPNTQTGTIWLHGEQPDVTFNATGVVANYVSAGALQVGAKNGASPLDGYVSEVRWWNTIRTNQQILDNMGLNLVGSESGLVFLARGDGNFNDLTANANNLAASNGATFQSGTTNYPWNPYKLKETFYVSMKPTYGAPNTTVTLYGGRGGGVLPNATLSAFEYSAADNPIGWPEDRGWWINRTYFYTTANATVAINYNSPGNFNIPVPAGEFRVRGSIQWQVNGTEILVGLSTTTGVAQPSTFRDSIVRNHWGAAGIYLGTNRMDELAKFAAVTPVYAVMQANGAAQADLRGDPASPQFSWLEIEPTFI